MTKIKEFWFVPLDEYGDSIEPVFCETLEEAIIEMEEYTGSDMVSYQIDEVTREYATDGELVDEIRHTIIEGHGQ